jgi:hypothetical protein
MRLTSLQKFRDLVYAPGSAPSLRTLRKRIHEIPGGTVELGHYYVDLDEYDRHHNLRAGVAETVAKLERSPLLESLL